MKRLILNLFQKANAWARQRPATAVKLLVTLPLFAFAFLPSGQAPPPRTSTAPTPSSFVLGLSYLMLFAGIATVAARYRKPRPAEPLSEQSNSRTLPTPPDSTNTGHSS